MPYLHYTSSYQPLVFTNVLLRPGDYDDILESCDQQNGQCLLVDFPDEIKKQVYCFVAGESLFVFKCVIDV